MGILLPVASGGRRDPEMGNPLAPYSTNQRDCECGEKVPHHAAPSLLLHTEQQRRSRRGRERGRGVLCVFNSYYLTPLLSSLSSAAAAAAAAGSTSSVRSFARPPVVPQTPLISFQDRSMTFCYAPQVQAEPSLLPPFPPAAVFADRLSLGPDLAARWTILFAK